MKLKDSSDILNSTPRPHPSINLTSQPREPTSFEPNTLAIYPSIHIMAMLACCSKIVEISDGKVISPMNEPDKGIFGYYNLLPDPPNPEPSPDKDGYKEWIPAGLRDKTFTPPIRPPGASRPTCLWVGVPIIPPSQSLLIPARRQYVPKPHLARSLPYFDTESYLLRLPFQPPTRFYKSDLLDTQLADPRDYIRWVSEMKTKLMQSKTWRLVEDDLEPVPRTSGLHPKWEQVNQQVWFLILANVSREIRQEICEAHAWDVQGSWCYLVRFGRAA